VFARTGSLAPEAAEPLETAKPKGSLSPGADWAMLEQIPMFAGATMDAITSTTMHLCQGVVEAAGKARKSFLGTPDAPSS
jgi:hypothetical protein